MARITVEDCLRSVDNRFGLIHLAAKRVRQLRKGAEPMEVCKNKDVVVALREIAAGKVIQLKGEELDSLRAGNIDASLNALPDQVETEPPSENGEDQETVENASLNQEQEDQEAAPEEK
ncbi:MAG: DNA-directed RNA polymerase subunit omega [Deltaproteobacteria bacterium]|nr:DNA-directed RNA polymerase subunit omega [Deltaproteobacteria bacterium]